MKLGIDLQFIVADQRGMGRLVRNTLAHFPKTGANLPEYIFFAKNSEIVTVKSLLSDLGFAAAPYQILPFSQCSQTPVDVCWYPWNRIDAVPASGKRLLMMNDVAPFAFPYKSIWRYWDQRKDEQRFKKAVHLADTIITISEFSKSEIMRYLSVPAEKIQVIYLGVNPFFQPAPSTPNSKTSFGFPYFLFVGSNDQRKNLAGLIAGFQKFKQMTPGPHKLVCCGTGKNEQNYDDILFLDPVSDEILLQYYQNAVAFVFPSLYEGFGLPILEAMASGTAVVSSNTSSLPEVGGSAALYCDPYSPESIADCLKIIVENTALRSNLIQLGFDQVKRFDWASTADQIINHCRSI